ncbi:flagellar biosynthesis protein FlhF [Geoalkalibacter sp.]|uniref:flagellar biosynthesis protein FlhF n=1 Tax=Geoalkalibacter sp. TaxID=3041440 RepID=UPI00272E0E43|nr:flagellar biosynthesis protein FlhF [Geoalkalibacter sp.]
MLVKVFESEDMASALKKVKEALGPDALILSTRTIRKGGLGVLGKPILEVTAAIESTTPAAAGRATEPRRAPSAVAARRARGDAAGEDLSYEEIWAERRPDPPARLAPPATPVRERTEFDSLRGEIDELKSLVQNFISEARTATPPSAPLPATAPPLPCVAPPEPPSVAPRRRAASAAPGEPRLDPLIALLRARGINEEAAETIARFAAQRAGAGQLQNPEVMRALFSDVIGDLIQVSRPARRGQGQRRLALIGPTGVGKTTTIAKLAAEHLLSGGKGVALVTIDTFRIAAVEQLKVYGEIMKLPVEVVVSPKQMRGVLNRHNDKDLILIDTAGRSPRDDLSLQGLSEILTPELRTENHLVLSAATRDEDLCDAVARFGRVPLHNLIFTKIDECAALGVLLNVHLRHNFPLAYLTNGQRVPEDILVADAKKIAQLIMGQG